MKLKSVSKEWKTVNRLWKDLDNCNYTRLTRRAEKGIEILNSYIVMSNVLRYTNRYIKRRSNV